ncbi:hypothetical protein [Afipia sp. Root123D2]|uniref:hypothetical protein n=1 Tax=Afipia sp. Root123D2 TaxID=1736436 RepID=UPI0012E97364|nr:hypothetical protein [Afipia sp. Root123D2]
MPNSENRPICPQCHQRKVFALQVGGKKPRTWQCLDCDRPDPLHMPEITNLMKAILPLEGG